MKFVLGLPIVQDLWIVFLLYWLISALKVKRTKRREAWHERLLYVLPIVGSCWLLFSWRASFGWLARRFVLSDPAVQWSGVALTAAGIGIAICARWHLGANWSGSVTLKAGHELIRTGPYRTIRHPIYTGILLGLVGTAVVIGEVRGLLAMPLAWLSFYWKALREESFLAQEFGPSFIEHRQQTGMFLPRLP